MNDETSETAHGVAYVDFYRNLGISPVAQDISDLRRHFSRRDSLYRFLGIPPALVAGRSVIEFGPGSGHNALFTAALRPARYVLVDGNPVGVAQTRENLQRHGFCGPNIEVTESLFEHFDSVERFDIVLAEGFLAPHATAPVDLLRRLSRFVKPGGIMVITTVSAASLLSEMVRRMMRNRLIAPTAPAAEQVALLRPLLGPHLATLKGMSRSVDDWLLDNIVQPVVPTGLLTIPQAIAALAPTFDAYGSSPSFVTDLRWYKDVHGDDRGFNAGFISCYFRRLAALVDYRFSPPEHAEETGRALEAQCEALWKLVNACEAAGVVGDRAAEVVGLLESLASLLGPALPETAAALSEVAGVFAGKRQEAGLSLFPALWGRGQQYLSLICREPIS